MRILLLASLITVVAQPVISATLRVPAEYPTINDGLDAAVSGDTVLVAPGIYSEYDTRLTNVGLGPVSSVAFLKGGVTLESEGGPTVTTMTMTSTVASANLTWYDLDEGEVTVTGFRFTGDLESIAAMSSVLSSKITVRDCVFEDIGDGTSNQRAIGLTATDADVFNCVFRNINGGTSAAIVVPDGRVLVEDCLFENIRNGALSVHDNSHYHRDKELTIRRCTFRDNERSAGQGGAVYAEVDALRVEDCLFDSNRCVNSSGGALIASVHGGGEFYVRRCVFSNNSAGGNGEGGAIQLWSFLSEIELMSCTFYGNSNQSPFQGSTVSIRGVLVPPVVHAYNNVFASSSGGAAVSVEEAAMDSGCNVYWDNPDGHVEGFEMDSTSVIADPLFCDPENGEFSVDALSPCLPQNSGACGLIGVYGQGCGAVSIDRTSWGRLKSRFRPEAHR